MPKTRNGVKKRLKTSSDKSSYMPEPNLFQIFVSRLNRLDIRYMVTGAVASIIYGEPRLTHDIDLVVELNPQNAEKIIDAFPSSEHDSKYLP